MKSIGWILGAVVAFMAVRYAAREGMQSLVKSVTDKAATCLAMLGSTTRDEDRFTYIVGSVRNKCDQKFGSVTITFKLDRQSGSPVLPQTMVPTYGSSSQRNQPISSSKPAFELPEAIVYAYIRDLKPGDTREFKSAIHIPSNSTFRFDAIRAY